MQQSCPKHLKHLVVKPGSKVDLGDIDPRDVDCLGKEEAVRAKLEEDVIAIDALQDRLYAEGKRALLVVLQGTDTSGKDGTIRGVFNTTGPLGVTVTPSRSRARRNSPMISSGASTWPPPAAARSASSTARITRTCWSAASASSRRRR